MRLPVGAVPSPDPPKFHTTVSVLAQAVTWSAISIPMVASLIFIASPRALFQFTITGARPAGYRFGLHVQSREFHKRRLDQEVSPAKAAIFGGVGRTAGRLKETP